MKFLSLFLLSFLLMGTVNIEMGEPPPDYGQIFAEIMMKAGQSLQDVAQRRPLKVKSMNDSLTKTAQAMVGIASKQPTDEIFKLLEGAQKDYPENSFPLLLKGLLLNSSGDLQEANQYFETFLMESRTYTDFEKTFLSLDDFHKLRRVIYELITSRGVSFQGRESQIRARVPFDQLMKYVMEPSSQDRFYNYAFIFALVFGTLLIFGSALRGTDFSGDWMMSLLILYVTSWIGYAFWIIDLAFGLPPVLSRFRVVPFLFGGVAVLRGAVIIYKHWSHGRGPVEPGYKRCEHCRIQIMELVLECPQCGRRNA